MAKPLCDQTQEQLEKRLFKLYDEQREMENHPSYPWVSDIPGLKSCADEIDRIETELADRCSFGMIDTY